MSTATRWESNKNDAAHSHRGSLEGGAGLSEQWRGLQKGEKKMILSNVGIVHRLLNGLA